MLPVILNLGSLNLESANLAVVTATSTGRRPNRAKARRSALAALTLAVFLSACATTVDHRGYVPDQETIERLRAGVDNRDSVAQMLGSPSSVGTFSNATWYYVSKRTERIAFLNEKVVDQRVLSVAFDEDGLVIEIHEYALEDGRIIDPVTRKTPTHGRELNIIEQLFGNVGRFNNAGN